jgi:hypothetical protein
MKAYSNVKVRLDNLPHVFWDFLLVLLQGQDLSLSSEQATGTGP